MQDILKDLVGHTHSLGFLPLVKITGDKDTVIESMAEESRIQRWC
jgi:hypothetical protein